MRRLNRPAARMIQPVCHAILVLLAVGFFGAIHGCSAQRASDAKMQLPASVATPERPLSYDDILRYPNGWPELPKNRAGANPGTDLSSVLSPSTAVPGTIGRHGVAPTPLADLSQWVPPQSLPARGDELWVIEKRDAGRNPPADVHDEIPGSGSLVQERC